MRCCFFAPALLGANVTMDDSLTLNSIRLREIPVALRLALAINVLANPLAAYPRAAAGIYRFSYAFRRGNGGWSTLAFAAGMASAKNLVWAATLNSCPQNPRSHPCA